MSKIDANQVAGIVANVGIIASILFLACELRQNTITSRSQASQGLQDQIAVNLALTTDPVLADIFLRAGQDPSALENMYFQVSEGNYDRDRAAGWWQLLRNMLGLPGVRLHWESRQYLFSPEFTGYVSRRSDRMLVFRARSHYRPQAVIENRKPRRAGATSQLRVLRPRSAA